MPRKPAAAPAPEPVDAVTAAIERVAIKAEPEVKVKVKRHGRHANKERKTKGERVLYAEYAPHRFKRHPLARGVNLALDTSSPTADKDATAKACEVGESWTAAAYYGLGLPAYDPNEQGDGHPYLVAVERTGRWAFPRVAASPTFATLKALVKARLGGKRA